MRLERLKLRNFKVFEDVDIRLAPLTVFIGRNNAGKSTVLQALALLSQSADSGLIQLVGPTMDLGGDARALINRGSSRGEGAEWEIEITWAGSASDIVEDLHSESAVRLRFTTTFRDQPRRGVESKFLVEVPDPYNRMVTVTVGDPEGPEAQSVTAHAPRAVSADVALDEIDRRWPLMGRGLFSVNVGPPPGTTMARAVEDPQLNLLEYVLKIARPLMLESVRDSLHSYVYVGPNRHIDHSRYPLGPQPPPSINTAQDLLTTLAYSHDLMDRVSQRCYDIFQYHVALQLVPPQQVTLQAKSTTRDINIVNMGTGFVQLMWMVVAVELAASSPSEGPTGRALGIEEPELHLHPAAQPAVADVLARSAQSGVQVLCTTQSEHLLTSLLTKVVAGELDAQSLALYYVEDGQISPMIINERGQVKGGLRGFFEANEEQLETYIRLLGQRA